MSVWKCEYCHHLVDSLYHQCVNKQLIENDLKETEDEETICTNCTGDAHCGNGRCDECS